MRCKITIIVIMLFVIAGGAFCFAASTREQLYRKFGPQLIEAIVMVIKDEINLLRAQHGLAPRTNQQLINAIDTKLADVNEYNWMQN